MIQNIYSGSIMKRKIFIFLIVVTVFLFTVMPTVVSEGAKEGLLLWFMAIVPSLFPFMILSNILIKLKVTKYINRILKPVFGFLFGIREDGSYPVLIGFLAGCPIGAKSVAQLYKNGELKKSESQYLITFCNNLSPMFLIEFIGVKCLGVKEPVLIFGVVVTSALINAFFYRIVNSLEKTVDMDIENKNNIKDKQLESDKNYPIMDAVDESIADSCETILKIGGYIILFSIITSIIEYMIPQKYSVVGCVLAGVFEVSTGAMQLAENDILSEISFFMTDVKIILTIWFCAFGGISSVAQTYSVLSGTDLSIKKYVAAKIRQGFIAVILALLVFRI